MEDATKDTSDMSVEELEVFINKAQGQDVDIEVCETVVEEPEEEEEESDDAKPYFKGKSKKELIEIIENGTKKISQQGNEIHTIKQTLEELKQQLTAPVKEEPDELSAYDADDLKVIERVVVKTMTAKERLGEEAKQKEIDHAKNVNEIVWDALPKEDQDAMFPEMEKMFKADPANTLNRAGWVKEFYHAWKSKPQETTIKKKVVQIIGGGQPQQSQKKSVQDMTAEEYLEHVRAKGLNI